MKQSRTHHTSVRARLLLLTTLLVPPASVRANEIVAFPAAQEHVLREQGVEVWTRSGDVLVGGGDEEALATLAEIDVRPIASVPDAGQWLYLFHHDAEQTSPPVPDAAIFPLNETTDLYVFPGDRQTTLPRGSWRGSFMGVARLPLPAMAPRRADLVRSTPASAPEADPPAGHVVALRQGEESVNPLVAAIVDATSQAAWFQYVKDLSGENSVVVGGRSRTISTRYSDAMFPTPQDNAHATEYLLEKAAGWGYRGVREIYTNAESGCGAQSAAWQNVVFTIPGQVDYDEHQQVLFVTHYDSLSYSVAASFDYAPGADDAISGGSALIEALRLFKDYAFRNTVKIVFFSGEEEGLCGSSAYVRQHPTADMWRVVNMDQTAYDGNLDRVMNCYNWDASSSSASVDLGDAFARANGDYGSIIAPANIVRDGSYMCQTDHCPFWNMGVAAIALLEDLHDYDLCPCFDQSQTATCHDTVTQMDPHNPSRLMFDQTYSWPTEKAAIALVASLADPLYACPPSAPAVMATPGNGSVRLSWEAAPGVTNCVIERAPSCTDPFAPVATSTGTSYDDVDVEEGATYAYRIRTCPNQTSECVTASPELAFTATSTPTATLPPTPTRSAPACPGDCSANGEVAINELIALVNIALGSTSPATCGHGMAGAVAADVALLVQAVNSSLNGCGIS